MNTDKPSKVLLHYLQTMKQSYQHLLQTVEMSDTKIKALANGEIPFTLDDSIKLGAYFQLRPDYFIHLQNTYDCLYLCTQHPQYKHYYEQIIQAANYATSQAMNDTTASNSFYQETLYQSCF